MDPLMDFSSMKLPAVKNLTKLMIGFRHNDYDVISLCNAFKKMPKLKYFHIFCHDLCAKDTLVHFVCRLALVVATQKKDLEVTHFDDDETLRITSKSGQYSDTEVPKLSLMISSFDFIEFPIVKAFVKKYLKSHHAVVIQNNYVF